METPLERRYRRFLLGLSAFICVGTVVELWLTEHTEDAIQFVPFVLCGIGLVAILAALLRPQRGTLLALRVVMLLLVAGSVLGMYEHLAGNFGCEMEIRPGSTFSDVWFAALRGSNPLLAPGILALAGILSTAATYRHPALARDTQEPSGEALVKRSAP